MHSLQTLQNKAEQCCLHGVPCVHLLLNSWVLCGNVGTRNGSAANEHTASTQHRSLAVLLTFTAMLQAAYDGKCVSSDQAAQHHMLIRKSEQD